MGSVDADVLLTPGTDAALTTHSGTYVRVKGADCVTQGGNLKCGAGAQRVQAQGETQPGVMRGTLLRQPTELQELRSKDSYFLITLIN